MTNNEIGISILGAINKLSIFYNLDQISLAKLCLLDKTM